MQDKEKEALKRKCLGFKSIGRLFDFLSHTLYSKDIENEMLDCWCAKYIGVCAHCGRSLHKNLPKIYPDKWKLCCTCFVNFYKYIDGKYTFITDSHKLILIDQGAMHYEADLSNLLKIFTVKT